MSSAPLTKKTRSSQQSSSAWGRHQSYMRDYAAFNNPSGLQQSQSRPGKTEDEILKENHRLLRSDREDEELPWEQRVAKKYYDKLFKEYALVELRFYKEGRFAVRWRNEKEVIQGKGQFTCASLRCVESSDLQSWEVNFAYVEVGEKKNALVKVRLCKDCSYKLNYKKPQKRAEHKSDVDRIGATDTDENGSGPPGRRRHHRSATGKVESDTGYDVETRSASISAILRKNNDLTTRSSAQPAGRERREKARSGESPEQETRDISASRKRRAEDDAKPSSDACEI